MVREASRSQLQEWACGSEAAHGGQAGEDAALLRTLYSKGYPETVFACPGLHLQCITYRLLGAEVQQTSQM